MTPKKTMTLNLTVQEMDVLTDLARKKGKTKTTIMRDALRIYRMFDDNEASFVWKHTYMPKLMQCGVCRRPVECNKPCPHCNPEPTA